MGVLKMTILQYLKNGNNFYSSSLETLDYISSDIITSLETILKNKYGALTLITDDETEIQNIIESMFMLNNDRYTALFNIDLITDPSSEFYEKETNSGTVTHTLTPSVVSTTTEKRNTADNATMRNVGQVENSSTGSDTNEREDDLTKEREGYNDIFNNGLRMLELSRNALYDIIIKDTIDNVCYNIYGKEDLTI